MIKLGEVAIHDIPTADLIAQYDALGEGDEPQIMRIVEEMSKRAEPGPRCDLAAAAWFGPVEPD